MPSALHDGSHRRFNPLSGERVLVSPHRMRRPWQGRREPMAAACFARARSQLLSRPAICAPTAPAIPTTRTHSCSTTIFRRSSATRQRNRRTMDVGRGRRIGNLPRPLLLACARSNAVRHARSPTSNGCPNAWVEETISLGGRPDIASVQIFENRGEMMGGRIPIRMAKSGRLAICRTSWTRKRGGRTTISSKPDGRCSSTIWSASLISANGSCSPTTTFALSCPSGRSGRSRR